MEKKKKGLIFVNPYLVPKESIYQAERLKEEFNNLGVDIEIVSDGCFRVVMDGDKTNIDLTASDFAVYLDKDKYLSEILEKGGLRLFNKHQAVRVCDDKAQTYIALAGNGIKFPKTIFGALCYSDSLKLKEEWANIIIDELSFPLVVKESYGSMGKGVYLVNDKEELLSVMEKVKTKPHLFQEYIAHRKGVDVRVIVIGGREVASMERRNENDFRSNVAQGGSGVKVEISEKFRIVAESVAEILELDYCGVDLLYGENNEPIVCEVNSNAFIGGIEQATGVNVAKKYAEHIFNTIYK
ncbi:MAG: RimK family alpha-L-glutamate ligase [Clostridiales bacterium]|nr:RimK family alpha-L-glutamate ligase [Clostridiales bacterium]